MSSIYISNLISNTSITNDDFIPVVQSSSLTTYKVNFGTIGNWMSSSVTSSWALYAKTASLSNTASNSNTSSVSFTASYLLYSGIPNGTSSYAISSSISERALYFDSSSFRAGFAYTARSASWASQSLSTSYVSGSNVHGKVTSASYAIQSTITTVATYGLLSTYSISSSYATTSSLALLADTTLYNPKSIYGPFTASANTTSPTVGWSQWDYEKKAVAFSLASNSDVIIECEMNYAIDENSPTKYYVAGIVRAGGIDDPTVNPPTSVSDFDDYKFISLYNFETNTRLDNISKFYIKKDGLTTGKWVLYLLFYSTTANITPWGTSGVAQKTDIDNFLASSPTRETSQVRFYKFANSVIVNIYATTAVTQDIL